MTPKATIFHTEVSLADNDRSVYEDIKLTLAMHPSETTEFMLTRMLAYCCELCEGITFSKGLADPDEPAIWARSLSGELKLWIEIGAPSAEKVHRASKSGARVAVYTHRNPELVLQQLNGKGIFKAAQIPIYSFSQPFLIELGREIEKRSQLALTISEKNLYIEINGRNIATLVKEHSIDGEG